MRGKILNFDQATETGKINGYDGNRYDFQATEWRSSNAPTQSLEVDFEVIEGKASDVFCLSTEVNNNPIKHSEKIGALGILCFLIPIIGFILYSLWKEQKPLKAKGAIHAAIFGSILVIIWIALGIIINALVVY